MVEDKDKMIVTETQPMGVSTDPHDRAHERRDVNIRAILWSLAGIAITVGLVCMIVWGMFQVFESREAKLDIPPSPVADTNAMPPLPRLQQSPAMDMGSWRMHEDSILNNYGWVDRPAGITRIPIDSAIDRIARNGLSIVTAGGPDTAALRHQTGPDSTTQATPRPSVPTEVRPQGGDLERR